MQKFLKKALVFTIVTVLLTALGSSVIAVDFSKDNTGAHDSVFIAGNPDMYPLEYYDPALNKYRGVLPELYEKISEETGISFTYIYTSSQNKQEYLANNSQVDIVSAHLSSDGIKNLEEALKLEYTVNGKEYTAVVGFTSVCPEEVKTAIKGYISSMEKDQLASMTVSFVIGTGERHSVYYIECIVMAVIILVLAFLTVYFYKKLSNLKKNVLYSQQYDPQTGIYNAQFFLGMINTELSHQARTLYYATAICANHTELKKHYSDEEIAELQQYIARSLSQECGEAEFCAKDIETTFFLVFKETNREKAVNRLDILMKKLNMENGILKDEHKVKLRAGVYELSEKFESSDYIFNIAKEAFLSAEKEDELYFFATESLVIATTQKKSFQKKDMERILANGEILYYLQFIVDTDTGNIWGAEAMSRWEHPAMVFLCPASM
jgi:GGDEF domain-containing protein